MSESYCTNVPRIRARYPDAKTLLVVYGVPTINDIEVGYVHTYDIGASMAPRQVEGEDWVRKPQPPPAKTIDNILECAGFLDLSSEWDIRFLSWETCDTSEMSEEELLRQHAEFTARLESKIAKFNPDRIAFFGDDPLPTLLPGPYIHIGRVFNVGDIPAIWTYPVRPLTSNDPTTSMLAGKAVEHLSYLRKGKSRYTAPKTEHTIINCTTVAQVKEALEDIKKSEVIAYDTEGANLNRILNTLLTVQIAVSAEKAYFIPYAHIDSPFSGDKLEQVRELLHDFFYNYEGTVITAHGKYDMNMLRNVVGVPHMRFGIYDVASAEYAMDENAKYNTSIQSKQTGKNLSAWSLAKLESDYGIDRPDDVLGKSQRTNMSEVPLEKIMPYGILDVVNLFLIREQQLKMAKAKQYDGFEQYVLHLGVMIHVFATMEHRGMPIDTDKLLELRGPNSKAVQVIKNNRKAIMDSEAATKANKIMSKTAGMPQNTLWGSAPTVFNIDKQDSQQVLFFDVLRLGGVFSKSGRRSIGKSFLEKNANNPIVAMYREYTEAKKFKTGFVDSFAEIMSSDPDAIETGRIRSSYGFLNVVTGRSSSTNPNLQNLPSRGSLAKLIKAVFTATKGNIILKQDFSANEVRGLAMAANDVVYASEFWKAIKLHKAYIVAGDNAKAHAKQEWKVKGDIHINGVKRFFGRDVDKNHPLRQAIKSVAFGLIYGQSTKALAENLALNEIKTIKAEIEGLEKDGE